jgi:hypothetical protein
VKSTSALTVAAGMPGPWSATMIRSCSTVTAMSGARSAFSAASRALSISSLTTTSGHKDAGCPTCLVSSDSVANSLSREVVNVFRSNVLAGRSFIAPSRIAGCPEGAAWREYPFPKFS